MHIAASWRVTCTHSRPDRCNRWWQHAVLVSARTRWYVQQREGFRVGQVQKLPHLLGLDAFLQEKTAWCCGQLQPRYLADHMHSCTHSACRKGGKLRGSSIVALQQYAASCEVPNSTWTSYTSFFQAAFGSGASGSPASLLIASATRDKAGAVSGSSMNPCNSLVHAVQAATAALAMVSEKAAGSIAAAAQLNDSGSNHCCVSCLANITIH
jgi:hypothetical protein